ncbi:MAG: histidine phosphatase family protein [Lutimaribacter sp.]
MARFFIALFLLVVAQPVLANDWQALRAPGAVVLMRHALAPGTGDPGHFDLARCETQRNLDARGRAQAQAIGQMLAAQGIGFDHVFSSQWCRCRDTAQLLELGPVDDQPALNSFFQNYGAEAAQTQAAMRLIQENAGQRLFLVTHQVNIRALTGVGARSGEMIVAQLREGRLQVTGRVMIAP